MNTQIQEAATKWWETLTVEEIATIYLKEHESKEETLEDAELRMSYQSADWQDFENKTGNYKEVPEIKAGDVIQRVNPNGEKVGPPFIADETNAMFQDGRFKKAQVSEPKNVIEEDRRKGIFFAGNEMTDDEGCFPPSIYLPKEEPVSVEEAARLKFRTIGLPYTPNTHPIKFYEWGAMFGANWQKEQDKAIISELLEAAKLNEAGFEESGWGFNIEHRKVLQSAITKAEFYLSK